MAAPVGHDDERDIIDAIVDGIDRTLNAALYDIGFLEGTIGNDLVGIKIAGSLSGHTMDIAIRAVIIKSLLFVTRSWDQNGDSIPRALRRIVGWGSQLEADRKSRRPDFPDDFLELGQVENKINELVADAEAFQNKPEFVAARLHRDEQVAHLLKGKSGFRRKLSKDGIDVDPVTYNQVIELSRETAVFCSRILQVWQFTLKDPKDWIKNSRKNTELFWTVLPRLSEAERNCDPNLG